MAALRAPADSVEVVRATYPRRLEDVGLVVQAIGEGRIVHVADALQDSSSNRVVDEAVGLRGELSVPMWREGRCIGAIVMARPEPGLFSESQVGLIRTLADQAAIAIENVRLFKELETRNRDLTEALQQQTATGEILRVIASSPTDVQPVFQAIVESAARLCDATFSAVAQHEDGLLHLVAINNMAPREAEAYHSLFPRAPHRRFVMGRAFVDGRPVHVGDVLADPDSDTHTLEVLQRAAPYRTLLGVPLTRNGVPIGTIGCGRREVKPFTETQMR
jgi:two-component system, NtrC family, sensor kinase